ncbi:MAG: efflux RND transporter periplasmic adaptor subunit [Candidatus Zixiibacteriota bacterium]
MKFKITLILLLLVMLSGCSQKNNEANQPKKSAHLVKTAIAKQTDLSKTVTFTGSVEPIKIAKMASPAEGPVIKCAVREGDKVNTGQLLVQIGRSNSATSALLAAREELKEQETELKSIEKLVESGSLPGDKLDKVRSNYYRAKAQVSNMETNLTDFEIRAPWSGIVSKVWTSEGDYVSPRSSLIEIYKPTSMVVRISVPEKYALSIDEGMNVDIKLDAYPGETFTGEISRIYPDLDRKTRTVTVEAVIKEEIKLMNGMFARIDIPVKTVGNAVTFPEKALLVRPNGDKVVFVVDNKKAQEVKVNPVLEAQGLIAVTKGVKSGDEIVVGGNETLKDGATVTQKPAKKKESK